MEKKKQLKAPEEFAKEATELTAFNGINLMGIKDTLESMLGLIGRDGIFDEYTEHNIEHVNTMIGLVNDIIPQKTQDIMTKADWLLIVLSIYFHDLGMLVSKDEYQNRNSNRQYVEFEEDYKSENDTYLNSLTPDEKERFIYQEYVRKNHGKRIADWLNGENEDLYDKKVLELVNGMVKGLKRLFVQDIALVCASHNEDDLANDTKYPVKRDYGMNADEKANIFYAALILRTADMLHITGDRAPSEEYQIISPRNPISQIEWAKQASVYSVSPKDQVDEDGNVDKSIQSDTFEVTGFFEDPKGFFPLMDYLNYAKNQLQTSFKLNEEKKKKYASEYDFPWKNIDGNNVQTKDYERHQLSFTIDQHKILDLLVGETLYNNITVSLRELAQNAIDAVKVKKYEYEYEGKGKYVPEVKVSWYPETRQLIVADNGTGMDMTIIENHLLKVGSSRYSDEDFKKKHPYFYSISKFGIGLLTCFLVADDVDILTKKESEKKPLLLKVSKLHGKYLLKHGKEGNSQLSLLDETGSGTSIMLRIKNEITDFNPEHILREWILFPDCSFSYLENGTETRIGYDNTQALIEEVMYKSGISVDNDEYDIFRYNDENIDISILLRYNKFLKEWSFVHNSVIERRENNIVWPTGLSIKGIRIDKNTPGFKSSQFIVVANLIGGNAPYPNVARTAINDQSLSGILETVYDIYLQEIKSQIDEIANQYSITWALTELPYLLATIFERDKDEIIDKEVLSKSLEKQSFYLVYSDSNKCHNLLSIEELKELGHFWIIDSVAYDSALRLISEAKAPKQSAITLLNSLYEEECCMFNDVDVVLENGLTFEELRNPLFDNFEITDICVFEEFRSLNLKWAKKNNASPKWIEIEALSSARFNRHRHYTHNSLFIQNGSVNKNFNGRYESIRFPYGLFILEGSPIHKYIKDLINTSNKSISVVCEFVALLFVNRLKVEDWENLFEDYLTRKYSLNYLQRLESYISIDDLVEACKSSSFTMYDRRLWYRE